MELFELEKKNNAVCCCGGTQGEVKIESECDCNKGENVIEENKCCGNKSSSDYKGITSIKVLGSGCKKCHKLYENVKKAVEELNLKIEVEYIIDMEKVMSYGIMSMPAIVVNEKVASMGRLLKTSEVSKLLESIN